MLEILIVSDHTYTGSSHPLIEIFEDIKMTSLLQRTDSRTSTKLSNILPLTWVTKGAYRSVEPRTTSVKLQVWTYICNCVCTLYDSRYVLMNWIHRVRTHPYDQPRNLYYPIILFRIMRVKTHHQGPRVQGHEFMYQNNLIQSEHANDWRDVAAILCTSTNSDINSYCV